MSETATIEPTAKTPKPRSLRGRFIAIGAVVVSAGLALAGLFGPSADATSKQISFPLARSAGIVAANCLPRAKAQVIVQRSGATETMKIFASGLPKNTEFDVFVIQVPGAPFGVSWYQGDLETDSVGNAKGTYVGRFSIETFAIAPNTAVAPSVHSTPTPDATSNPPFGPIHTYHVAFWFNSPADAAAAGCSGATTPFNGEHNAGVQVMTSSGFANDAGPLKALTP
jgi:hypothetical protein